MCLPRSMRSGVGSTVSCRGGRPCFIYAIFTPREEAVVRINPIATHRLPTRAAGQRTMGLRVRQAARMPNAMAIVATKISAIARRFPSIGVNNRGKAGRIRRRIYIPQIMAASNSTLLDARALDRTLRRMADEILELNDG